jgi:transcriptional regulator with XRE-family HTH domain
MEKIMSLGIRLKQAREQRGLSQRELARLAQVDHAWISRVEEGLRHNISFEAAKRLARELGVTLDYLGEMDEQNAVAPRRGRPPKRRPTTDDEEDHAA